MKKTILFILAGFFLLSCSKDDGSLQQVNRNIINEDGAVNFENLLFLINLKTKDNDYLVVKSIDSLRIFINDMHWSTTNSQQVDVNKWDVITVGNQYRSTNKMNYLVVAKYNVDIPYFHTAGEIASYLNGLYQLKPGEYVCMIDYFQVTLNDKTVMKFNPHHFSVFKIEKDMKSVYVDEIELKLDI